MLNVIDLHADYGAATALNGVTIDVDSNEIVVLLGRNGMGKTSTVKVIMRLDQPTVTGGSVGFDDADLLQVTPHLVPRHGLGYVPQGRRVFASLTVEENLTTTARANTDGTVAWTLERVYETFPRLAERRRQRGGNLSGGEQQMLAIGRALLTNPRLVVLDEPSEGLAPNIVEQVSTTIHALKNENMSVLIAEQDVRFALGLADRVFVLENGRTVASGTPAEIDADTALKKRYLGVGGSAAR